MVLFLAIVFGIYLSRPISQQYQIFAISKLTLRLIGIILESRRTNLKISIYQSPVKLSSPTIIKLRITIRRNKILERVLISLSTNPTFDLGYLLFIYERVCLPVYITSAQIVAEEAILVLAQRVLLSPSP